jgi:flavin-dependent dehydrogenase
MTLLDRKRLDQIVARNAVANGATLIEGAHARRIVRQPNGITVEADCAEGRRRFTGRVLIGADGAGSLVSRFLGNSPKNLTKAVSVRGYYEGATADHALARVYFNEEFFPGYGWIFVNDRGHANVGVGYICDGSFPLRVNLKEQFHAFVSKELADLLGPAAASSPLTGGWAAYCRPAARTAERVVLIGDAGNSGDPLNGAGIHRAFESAALAAGVLPTLLAEDNLSAPAMRRYDEALESVWGLDLQSADLLLTFAKNPHFRLFYLQLLEHIGSLSQHDQRFAEFASGIFTGMMPQRSYWSPSMLLAAFPKNPRAWLALVGGGSGTQGISAAAGVTRGLLAGLRNVLDHPAANLAWGVELGTKAMRLGWSMTADTLTSIGAPLTPAARRQPA